MEVIKTPEGKVIWKGDWKVGIMKRCEAYIEKTGEPIEVWTHNGTFLFAIQPKQDAPEKPIPESRRLRAIRAGIRYSEANDV